ncbi:DUF2147 domain-containing protein [Acidocella sp.]|uniref:DUF2147 domain-containing protein n=1 Tax=Acidocella sp. TaxID=50710 RepID=UPI003D015291
MSRLCAWVLAGLALASTNTARAASSSFTPGYWESTGHEIVLQIVPCGGDLCGFIAGIALTHPDDPMPKDWRGTPQCGFLMLRVSPETGEAGHWKGVLQDPRNGKVYRTTIKFDAQGNLDLHGYIGLPLLGETQLWPKFTGQVLPGCHVPSLDGTP